jgi:hypothetical protein
MKAYITLEYSSDGPPPSQVDSALRRIGLESQGTFYSLDRPTEAEVHRALDQVHETLKGTGTRYRVSTGRPAGREQKGRSRNEVMRWVDAGLADEGMADLMERDPQEFRRRAREAVDAAADRVLSLRQAEAQEAEDRRVQDTAKENIGVLLRTGGGKHFEEILGAMGLEEGMLIAVLEEMVGEGTVVAVQEDHHVIYALKEKIPSVPR